MAAFFSPFTGLATLLEKLNLTHRLPVETEDGWQAVEVQDLRDAINSDVITSGAMGLPDRVDEAGFREYTASDIYPVVVDQDGRALLYFDPSTNKFYVHGLSQQLEEIGDPRGDLDARGLREFLGDGPVYPLLTDKENRVLLGYNSDTQSLVGLAIGDSTGEYPEVAAVNHFLFYGQSLSVGATATDILSTTQPYNNITFNGGPRAAAGDYSAFKPLVEDALAAPDGGVNRGETPCSGAANYATRLAAVENGILPTDHVILATTAGHGGYLIEELEKDSSWYLKLLEHVSMAYALNEDYAVTSSAWIQGENNALEQTPFSTYRGKLAQLRVDIESDIKAVRGKPAPVWMLSYQTASRAAIWSDIALAQLDVCQKEDRFALATPIYHLPYYSDGTHLSSVGYKWLGAYFGRSYKQLVHDKRKPDWLNPLSATLTGTELRVRFKVPTLPLVLDTTTLAVTTDHGFKVNDSVGAIVINSITVDGNEIVLALNSAPVGATVVRYGLDYLGTGLIINSGASGNLRDSTPETVLIDSVERPLYHVCPHFQLDVVEHKEI